MTSTAAHGTLARYRAGCRRECCRAASRAYEKQRRSATAKGPRLIDAEPVRQHIAALRAAGLSPQQIAELSGVQPRRIHYVIHGAPARGLPPQNHIRADAARRILAVSPVPRHLPATGQVDGTGTRRRLRALAAIGWTTAELAAHMGRKPGALQRLTTTGDATPVHVDTARAVRRLYADLWNRPGPSARVRTKATRRGWLPPLAWDDDTIDNPATQPAQHPRRRDRPQPRSRPAAALLEDSDELLRQGLPFDLVAERLALKPDTLRSARTRARRHSRTAPRAAEGSR